MQKTLAAAFAVAAFGFTAPPAAAQYVDLGLAANIMTPVVLNPCPGGRCTGAPPAARRAPPPRYAPSVAGPASAAAFSTSYRPSPAVSARTKQQFLDYVAKVSGRDTAQKIGAEYNRINVLREWQKSVAEDGLRLGDVADSFTAYWVQNWQIANDVEYVEPRHVQAVRAQVVPIMASNPAFARLNEAQRQEMAEILIYNLSVQGAAFGGAKRSRDRDLQERLSAAAVARFRNEMKLDLRSLRLTDAGFVGG